MLENKFSLYLSYDDLKNSYSDYEVFKPSDSCDDVSDRLSDYCIFLGDALLDLDHSNFFSDAAIKLLGGRLSISKYYVVRHSQNEASKIRYGFMYKLYYTIKELHSEVNQDNYQEIEKLGCFCFDYGKEVIDYINQADIISGYNIKEGFDRRFDPSTFDNVLTAIGNFLTFRDEKMGEVHQSDYKNEKLFIKNGR